MVEYLVNLVNEVGGNDEVVDGSEALITWWNNRVLQMNECWEIKM